VESLFFTLAIGFVMDSITGGPFGIFISVYFWLFAGTRWGMQYFQTGTTFLLPFVIGAGVLVENIFILSVTAFTAKDALFPPGVTEQVAWQVFWAAVTGPIILMFIKFIHTGLNERFEEMYSGRDSTAL
jgi:rod shape-determining protein MreD